MTFFSRLRMLFVNFDTNFMSASSKKLKKIKIDEKELLMGIYFCIGGDNKRVCLLPELYILFIYFYIIYIYFCLKFKLISSIRL